MYEKRLCRYCGHPLYYVNIIPSRTSMDHYREKGLQLWLVDNCNNNKHGSLTKSSLINLHKHEISEHSVDVTHEVKFWDIVGSTRPAKIYLYAVWGKRLIASVSSTTWKHELPLTAKASLIVPMTLGGKIVGIADWISIGHTIQPPPEQDSAWGRMHTRSIQLTKLFVYRRSLWKLGKGWAICDKKGTGTSLDKIENPIGTVKARFSHRHWSTNHHIHSHLHARYTV